MKKLLSLIIITSILISIGFDAHAQLKRKVLFLGNSYTDVNNLPQLIHDVAISAGDTLIYDKNAPGGYRLENHFNDVTSKAKIMAGGWDYVVLQGQSQEPITNSNAFLNAGIELYTLIKQYNTCAVTMPYVTWGRKNGDAGNCPFFPEVCTYQGMDSTLKRKYLYLGYFINGEVSPVSVVWNYLRNNHPSIELYDADESHPNAAGSYAAACCFYASIFKKDPTLITDNFGLSTTDANIIKNAAKVEVYNKLSTWDFKKLPSSNFNYYLGNVANEIFFSPTNSYIKQTYFWDFGDGTTSTDPFPLHAFTTNGTYAVSLTTTTCDLQGLHTNILDTIIQFCNHTPSIYNKHNWLCESDTLFTELADSYQWLVNGLPIPETKRYVANYMKYNRGGFAVISTKNGCSELSEQFNKSPDWSGYYFDALGDPCDGDTVAFAVLHIDGFLSGNENILWYKNDTLLAGMTNDDTLFISSAGKYACKVINPISNCPLDTTWYEIKYDCNSTGIKINKEDLNWTIYPNPASDNISLKFTNPPYKETLEIYNTIGNLVKSIKINSSTMNINISDLPEGVYFIRLKNKLNGGARFVKL